MPTLCSVRSPSFKRIKLVCVVSPHAFVAMDRLNRYCEFLPSLYFVPSNHGILYDTLDDSPRGWLETKYLSLHHVEVFELREILPSWRTVAKNLVDFFQQSIFYLFVLRHVVKVLARKEDVESWPAIRNVII